MASSDASDGRPLNACLVGHGMTGIWHAQALREAGCVLHTLVGRRADPTRAFAEQHGFGRWTTSYEEALAASEIELVVLANPSEQHAAFAALALEYGKHVLVEIPLALELASAERLVADAARRGLQLGVVHPLRARPELIALRGRIAAGAERLQLISGRFLIHRLENVGASGYARSWTDNLLWHHMAHLVDAGLWVASAPSTGVESHMPPADRRTGIPMDAVLLARFGDAAALSVVGSYGCHERSFELVAVTDADSYRLDVLAGSLTTSAGTVAIEEEGANCRRITRDFAAAVAGGTRPSVSGEDVLPAMRVLGRVQDAWDARHGRQALPGRPLATTVEDGRHPRG
ncbi:MAG TPA: Gfo/Idh/MocA family oxidoreductase [Gaiellales bacterium]